MAAARNSALVYQYLKLRYFLNNSLNIESIELPSDYFMYILGLLLQQVNVSLF